MNGLCIHTAAHLKIIFISTTQTIGMEPINEYDITTLDLSELEQYIRLNGSEWHFKKNEYLLLQNESCQWVGLISRGMCRVTKITSDGSERIVGYCPEHHFVTDYTACLCQRPSLVNIQAMTATTIYKIPYSSLVSFWQSSPHRQELGRQVAEQLFAMTYRRLTESYCCTPEERYTSFMRHYPEMKERLPLKEIASFIGVSPETVSHIRKKLLKS